MSGKPVNFNQLSGNAVAAKGSSEFMAQFGKYIVLLLVAATIYLGVVVAGWKTIEPFAVSGSVAEIETLKKNQTTTLQNLFVNTAGARTQGTSLYTNLINELAPRERYLINLCPLTLRLPGYVGPWEAGVFDETNGIVAAMAAGVRGFFIPISTYYDDNKKPPLFPYSGDPATVARADTGRFLSKNGGFIRKIMEAIVRQKDAYGQYAEEPICIYLHADHTYLPSPTQNEKAYVKICEKLADELEPIRGFLPGQLGNMGYTQGGAGTTILLTQATLPMLKGKIIVFSNFDIRVERNPVHATKKKLGDFVNILYERPGENTTSIGGSTPTGKLYSFDSLQGASDVVKRESRVQYTFAVPANEQILGAKDIQKAIGMGVQCIPLDFVAHYKEERDAWMSWRGAGWIVKEKSLRFMVPEDIKPQAPSTRLNAQAPGAAFAGQVVVS
jgi:hypothetical protein